MSICNECWGKGWIKKQGVQFDCRKCKGTGVIENEPQTNEEWLRQATTEQLAEWIKGHMNCNFCPMKLTCEDMRDCMEHIKAWLKQPHTPIL